MVAVMNFGEGNVHKIFFKNSRIFFYKDIHDDTCDIPFLEILFKLPPGCASDKASSNRVDMRESYRSGTFMLARMPSTMNVSYTRTLFQSDASVS